MGADGKMNRHGETRADDDSARSSPQKKRRPVAFGGAPPPTDPDSLDRLAERFADAAARSMWDLHPDGDDAPRVHGGAAGTPDDAPRGSRGCDR